MRFMNLYSQILPNGQEDIKGIRLIRDPETLIGKGIGYMLFKDRDAVTKALTRHESTYKKRWQLRVTVCGKRTKRSEGLESSSKSKSPQRSSESLADKNKKKIDSPALKRINLKVRIDRFRALVN